MGGVSKGRRRGGEKIRTRLTNPSKKRGGGGELGGQERGKGGH